MQVPRHNAAALFLAYKMHMKSIPLVFTSGHDCGEPC